MDAPDLLLDLASRPRDAAARLRGRLDPATLRAHPGGHDNSPAWLLWHTGREVDVQLAALSDAEEVWTAQGHRDLLALGEAGDEVGYGHTSAQARRLVVEDGDALLDYVDAALAALEDYLGTLTAADLAEVVDSQWDPPVTRGVRLVSIVDDAVQHLAQAAYVLGMPQPV
ncbi:DinB family protein [Brachybacterium sp. YJGR34]|uniref:mycothiol transferase n=1 Tax=Brachybacterium sp. YJGR34 TaxID=2059911 RepID=UPI000E0BFD04|nr:DinB family protein [Brachybacterium sp. YJGR34]